MAATQYAKLATLYSFATSSPVLPSLFNDNESNADLFQIVNQSGKTVLAVQNNGSVNFNASGLTPVSGASASGSYTAIGGSTGRAQLGVFWAVPGYPTDTAAHAIAAAFTTNPESWDIIQVLSPGGAVNYYLDVNGVAHGS